MSDLDRAIADGAREVMTTDEIRRYVGEVVDVMFTDGGEPATGTLAGIEGDEILLEQEYEDGSKRIYTVHYSLSGDDLTPAVVDVRPVPAQTDTLF